MEGKRSEEEISQKSISHQDYVDCLFEERKFMHTIQLYEDLHINSTLSNKIKSPLALAMINDACWMTGLGLCQTVILVCCKYYRLFLIIFSETFQINF